MGKIIGIDLGTTKQLCSRNGRWTANSYRQHRRRKNNNHL